MREVPAERWTQEQLAVLPGPVAERMRYGGFLDGDIYAYEPEFFGINKQEAAWVDPQHRLLWEVSWEALEHAGIPPLSLKGSRTGLFFGIYSHDYEVRSRRPLELGDEPYALYTGLASVGSGRLAYLLDIRGPNITLDAQCASSLTAVHLACQSLRAGEADLALAGGVTLNLVPETAAVLASWSAFSPTGRSRAFDADADGYVRSEGCGVVALKRHEDALRDGDQVLAVLRGSAINHTGHGTRFTAPSAPPQAALAREALRRAGVEPGDIGMIEAHGTGTAVGDPIEFAALASVYGQGQARCALGSVKTNIGHAEPAAGVAGLLKAILAVRSGTIPASLHFTRWNPQIDADSTRLFVPTQPVPWPVPGPARLAAVSAFGINGTNAHVIVEQAPVPLAQSAAGAVGQRDSSGVPQIFPLSGGTAAAVRAGAARLAHWVDQHGQDTPLENIAYTLTVRRSHLRHRAAVVAGSTKELADKLCSLAQNETVDGVVEATALHDTGPGPVWMFSGHGSQWAGMGQNLLDVDAAFTRVIDDLEPLVAAESGFSLRETLGSPAEVTGFDRVQPTLFAVQLGIAAMWRAHGISPAAVVGHSMGEVAAAVTAGALDLADGARVICRRSRLALRTGDTGRMASVALPREQVEHDLAEQGADSVDVAVIASPASTVVGGNAKQVADMVAYWQQHDVFARLVNVDVASHTRHMDSILDDLQDVLEEVVAQPPTVPFYTTVRENPRADVVLDAAYWAANQREPVQFAPAVRALAADGYRVFLEISPHPLLGHALRETLTDAGTNDTAVIASMRRNAAGPAAFAARLAELHCAGHPVAWERRYPHGELADVPPTSWEREHHEIARLTPPRVHPLTGPYLADPGQDGTHYWQNVLDTTDLPWLEDHRVDGTAVLPGAAMCEMALAAATDLFAAEPTAVCVQDLELRNVLPLTEPVTVTAHATTTSADSALWELSVPGADAAGRTVHATARLFHHRAAPPAPADMDRLRAEHTHKESAEELYAHVREHFGLDYGPAFAGLVSLRVNHRQAEEEVSVLAELVLPDTARPPVRDLHWHPASMDICLQAVLMAWLATRAPADGVVLITRIGEVRLFGDITRGRYCHIRLERGATDDGATATVRLLDADGAVLATAEGGELVRLPARSEQEEFDSRLLQTRWEQTPLPEPAPAAGGRWLVVDAGGTQTAREVAGVLESHGATTTLATLPTPADTAHQHEQDTAGTGPARTRLRDCLRFAQAPLEGVAVLFGSDGAVDEDAPSRARHHAERLLLDIVQPLLSEGGDSPPRLWAITSTAHQVLPDDVPDLSQSGVRALLRVVSYEHPELRPTVLDTDSATSTGDIAQELLACPDGQDDIAHRGGHRYTARLCTRPLTDTDQQHRPIDWAADRVLLDQQHVGDLGSLRLTAGHRPPPGPDEVEIHVHATSLNYANVLMALGFYQQMRMPGDPAAAAVADSAGIITAVGEQVTDRRIGDRVTTVALDTPMASFVRVRADWTLPVPDTLSLEQAAGLPIAYLTAWYALHHQARVRPGESVLIHSASGGTGLAALHVARAHGAEVWATAGSETKRAYLRELGLKQVMDSRSLDFAEQIRSLTHGRGVDVVLNSLTGPAQSASLDLLARHGRFLEIGKRDIYGGTRLSLLPFRRHITFASIDMHLLLRKDPALIADLYEELSAAFADGTLPPLPVTCRPIKDAAEVFRTMAAARHTGKLILTWPGHGTTALPVRPRDVTVVRPEGSYLITGGLGGLGLLCARWLARSGAPHLVLTGRSQPSAEATRLIENLRAKGTRVDVVCADLAEAATAGHLVDTAQAAGFCLRGVLHCAAVIEDATAPNITPELLTRVWRPKADGTWNLHRATAGLDLDWWVAFSSIAAVLGSPGQGAYASANGWMDEFCTWRRAQNLPATAINWGAWAQHGRGQHLQQLGHTMIDPEEGIAALETILRHDRTRTGYSPLNPAQWLAAYPDTAELAYFTDLAPTQHATGPGSGGDDALAVLRAAPDEQRPSLLEGIIIQHITTTLGLEEGRCTAETSLTLLGLDSLRATEVRNRLQRDLHCTFPHTALWTNPTAAALTRYLLGQLTDQHLLTPAPAA
ncbi:hypothetical protein A4V12_09825 [Streptomyces noursei]|nr:hypothetical protein A4V12_09825 [Streptomyces noursei]